MTGTARPDDLGADEHLLDLVGTRAVLDHDRLQASAEGLELAALLSALASLSDRPLERPRPVQDRRTAGRLSRRTVGLVVASGLALSGATAAAAADRGPSARELTAVAAGPATRTDISPYPGPMVVRPPAAGAGVSRSRQRQAPAASASTASASASVEQPVTAAAASPPAAATPSTAPMTVPARDAGAPTPVQPTPQAPEAAAPTAPRQTAVPPSGRTTPGTAATTTPAPLPAFSQPRLRPEDDHRADVRGPDVRWRDRPDIDSPVDPARVGRDDDDRTVE